MPIAFHENWLIRFSGSTRVEFIGPRGEMSTLGEQAGSALLGKRGTIVYGISEDFFCYPDHPEMDLVWVAFDDDRLPRRQVSLAWLEKSF